MTLKALVNVVENNKNFAVDKNEFIKIRGRRRKLQR
jgi:hypothetical protein